MENFIILITVEKFRSKFNTSGFRVVHWNWPEHVVIIANLIKLKLSTTLVLNVSESKGNVRECKFSFRNTHDVCLSQLPVN